MKRPACVPLWRARVGGTRQLTPRVCLTRPRCALSDGIYGLCRAFYSQSTHQGHQEPPSSVEESATALLEVRWPAVQLSRTWRISRHKYIRTDSYPLPRVHHNKQRHSTHTHTCIRSRHHRRHKTGLAATLENAARSSFEAILRPLECQSKNESAVEQLALASVGPSLDGGFDLRAHMCEPKRDVWWELAPWLQRQEEVKVRVCVRACVSVCVRT